MPVYSALRDWSDAHARLTFRAKLKEVVQPAFVPGQDIRREEMGRDTPSLRLKTLAALFHTFRVKVPQQRLGQFPETSSAFLALVLSMAMIAPTMACPILRAFGSVMKPSAVVLL